MRQLGVCRTCIRKTGTHIGKAAGTTAFISYKDALTSYVALWALQGGGKGKQTSACTTTAIITQASAQAAADWWGIFTVPPVKHSASGLHLRRTDSPQLCAPFVLQIKNPRRLYGAPGVVNYNFNLHLKKLIAKTACIKSASKSAKSSVTTYECAHFCILLSIRCIFMRLLLHDKGDKSRGKTLFCEVFTQHFGYLG